MSRAPRVIVGVNFFVVIEVLRVSQLELFEDWGRRATFRVRAERA
ncbi:conserved membrane domain protein [Mycobacterium ulcerans str. Harvey]|uniref:Conserved membrane domain protein n=1 Tax=Mycobacterium ulcerans str. Harvey TaxID=1299332 RepID=A0ABN0R959_MYCUL|nr:conserved membrane domain protein [Mycobacterium ulcerans str. Harvey]